MSNAPSRPRFAIVVQIVEIPADVLIEDFFGDELPELPTFVVGEFDEFDDALAKAERIS